MDFIVEVFQPRDINDRRLPKDLNETTTKCQWVFATRCDGSRVLKVSGNINCMHFTF